MPGILILDELQSATEGGGIKLKDPLQTQDGTPLLSPSGEVSINFDNLANDSISGDKIHGGTISGSQLHTDVTFADVNSSIANDSISGDKIQGGIISGSIFVGMIASFAMSSTPTGWIVCNGAEYAIADYGDLYTAIGTTWGALTNGSGGAGSTHFRVPDLRGAFLRGTGTGVINGVNKAGETVGLFQVDEMTRYTGRFETASPGHMGKVSAFEGVGLAVAGTKTAVSGGYQGQPQRFQNTSGAASNGFAQIIIDIGDGDETRPYNASIQYCIKF